MLDTTFQKGEFLLAVGRSRTGDQLHKAFAGGAMNSHCNNHMHLRPITGTLRVRPGLFCVKCFGDDPTRSNPRLVATEIVA